MCEQTKILYEYGFTNSDLLALDNIKTDRNMEDFIPARIIESQRNRYKVICEYGEFPAEIKGSFYNTIVNANKTAFTIPISDIITPLISEEGEQFPVIGDFVLIKHNPHGSSLIGAVLPRRSKFSRSDFSGHAQAFAKNILEQIQTANFDYVFILSSLNQDFNHNRLLRYVTSAWQSGGYPVILLTKADICASGGGDPEEKAKEVRKLFSDVQGGIPVFCISSKTGYGLEELEPFLEPAKTVIFLGSSGVGKSSLLNRLAQNELMEVKAIRDADGKGRHTTTHRELFRLSSGALVIDTPGMRELGLFDSNEGISRTFSEVEELFSMCRFSDCTHQTEPGCAVLAALEDGSLQETQWKNYNALKKETAYVENHSAFLKAKRARFKSIAQIHRAKRNV